MKRTTKTEYCPKGEMEKRELSESVENPTPVKKQKDDRKNLAARLFFESIRLWMERFRPFETEYPIKSVLLKRDTRRNDREAPKARIIIELNWPCDFDHNGNDLIADDLREDVAAWIKEMNSKRMFDVDNSDKEENCTKTFETEVSWDLFERMCENWGPFFFPLVHYARGDEDRFSATELGMAALWKNQSPYCAVCTFIDESYSKKREN